MPATWWGEFWDEVPLEDLEELDFYPIDVVSLLLDEERSVTFTKGDEDVDLPVVR